MKNIYLILFSFFIVNAKDYQEKLVNNKIIGYGVYSCIKRYEAIKPLLNNFKRPFTILDIGAAQGYFSFKTAFEYRHSVSVMIENDIPIPFLFDKNSISLFNLCQMNTSLKNIIFLKKYVTVEDLKKLSKFEHFDVVFCFNVLHHFKDKSIDATDAVLSLGDYVIIEFPSYASQKLKNYIIKKTSETIGVFNRPPKGAIGTMRLYKNNIVSLGKKVGINLNTFNLFNGVWPNKTFIENNLKNIIDNCNCNVLPEDILIQGETLKNMNDLK